MVERTVTATTRAGAGGVPEVCTALHSRGAWRCVRGATRVALEGVAVRWRESEREERRERESSSARNLLEHTYLTSFQR